MYAYRRSVHSFLTPLRSIATNQRSFQTTRTRSDKMSAPYTPQDVQAVSAVVRALDNARKDKRKNGFSVKKTTFDVKGSTDGIQVDSWRMQDWDYKRPNLPTYARGLFTTKT